MFTKVLRLYFLCSFGGKSASQMWVKVESDFCHCTCTSLGLGAAILMKLTFLVIQFAWQSSG